MKKLLLLPLILLSFLLLTGCSSEPSYAYVKAYENKEMYNDWIKDVEFSDKMLVVDENNKPNVDQERFEIFLPKNIVESTRYTLTDIESIYTQKYEKVVAQGYSFSNLQQFSGYILNHINVQNKNIRESYNAADFQLDEKFAVSYFNTFGKTELSNFVAKDGLNRAVVTAYMPVKLEYYTAKKNSAAVKTLTTYTIIPVVSELTYATATKVSEKEIKLELDSNSRFNKFDSVELKVKDGLLA